MANLIDVLSQQSAQSNLADPTAPIKQGLQAGVQLAQAKQQLELQQQQQQQNEAQLTEQKGKMLANLYKAAAFADKTLYPSVRKRLEMTAGQLNVPVDLMALDDIKKDDARNLALQKTLTDVTSGKTPTDYAGFMAGLGDSPTIFQHLDSQITANAGNERKLQSEQAKADSAERIANVRANATTQAATIRATSPNGANGTLANEARIERLNMQESNRINNDSVIKKLADARNTLETGWDILTTKQKLTNEEFNDLQIELGGAIAGARGVSEGKLARTEYHTYGQELARLVQKVTGKPQDAVSPAILAQFRELYQHVRDANARNTNNRLDKLKRTSGIESVQQTQEDAIAQHQIEVADHSAPAPTGTPPPQPAQLTDKQKGIVQQAMQLKGPDGKPRFKTAEEAIAALHLGGK